MNGPLDRREFLQHALCGAGTLVATGCIFPAGPAGPPVESFLDDHGEPGMRRRTTAAVIGSGFGGAVAALRLGQAGVPTLVLERGRRWPIVPTADTFATARNLDGRAHWFRTTSFSWAGFAKPQPIDAQAGVLDVREESGITVLRGAGVGGGSLVYYASTIQPTRDAFRRVFPAELDYDELDRVYYPRVRALLNPAPVPDDVLATDYFKHLRVFARRARAAGLKPQRLEMNLRWDIVREELAGLRPPSAILGDLHYGCNSGAKNSLDQNYLPWAEATGNVEILPLHVVYAIRELPDGSYGIRYVRISTTGDVLERGEVQADYVFLAAGSIGTSELLVRAKATDDLSRLSDSVGQGWGTNGQTAAALLVAEQTHSRWGQQGFAASAFEAGVGPILYEDLPLADLSSDLPVDDHPLVLLILTIPTARGRFACAADGRGARLEWPGADEAQRYARRAILRFLQPGALPFTVVPALTAHPLGGAVMGQACDLFGRVHGYRGLYVVDGSLLPGTCGAVNPSLTIAALAERCLDHILAEDLGVP